MEGFGGRKVTWSGSETPQKATKALAKQEPEPQRLSPEILALREGLSFVDFDVVRKLFSQMYERYGFDSNDMNFFEREAITYKTGFVNDGLYDPEGNGLGIDLERIRKGRPENVQTQTEILGVLFHEETHAVGRVECHFDEAREDGPLLKMGYAIGIDASVDDPNRTDTGPQGTYLFESFNEGITELIAHRLLRSYAEETKKFEQEVDIYIEQRRQHPVHVLAQEFIDELTKQTGMDRDQVQETVIEQYFKASNFLEQMYRDYPDLHRGDGDMARFANA